MKSNYNVGISILKIWMCMSIVICHFYDTSIHNTLSVFFTLYGSYAVPIFVFISFLLTDVGKKNGIDAIKKRMIRLYKPQLFFSILYFFIYSIIPKEIACLYVGGYCIKRFDLANYIWC